MLYISLSAISTEIAYIWTSYYSRRRKWVEKVQNIIFYWRSLITVILKKITIQISSLSFFECCLDVSRPLKAFPIYLGKSTFALWKYGVPKIRRAELFPLIWGIFISDLGQSNRTEVEWYLFICLLQNSQSLSKNKYICPVSEQIQARACWT